MNAQYKNERCYSPKIEKPRSKQNINLQLLNKNRMSLGQIKRQSKISHNAPPMHQNIVNNISIFQKQQKNSKNTFIASSRERTPKKLYSRQEQIPNQINSLPQPYEKMILLYQKQNQNLRNQNSFLIDQLRLQKRKELNFKKKIAQLQQVIAGFSVSLDCEDIGLQRIQLPQGSKVPRNPKLYRSSRIGQSQQNVQNANIQNLSKDFYQMIAKCSRQKHPSQKKELRKSLARLAKQMKNLRDMEC